MAEGFKVQELAPLLYDRVSGHVKKIRTVHDAVANGAWENDVGSDRSSTSS